MPGPGYNFPRYRQCLYHQRGTHRQGYIRTARGACHSHKIHFTKARGRGETPEAESLERLNVEYIDLYQFHGISDFNSLDTVLASDGPISVVEKAKEMGLVKHIGITSHQMDVAKKAVASGRFETIMFPFNFVTSEAADELLPLARKHDVGFIVMKPLAGGMIDNAKIAFKYLLQFPDIVTICGIERVPEIEEIVKILEGPKTITAAELKQMEKLKEELGAPGFVTAATTVSLAVKA
jgi:uncharacterized protein